ncbi:FACT complex subunit SPT16-like isoform X2 [Papaver somniferum]|nr:FACT complex subunit SPT16-like isoform X2 [Papaver somniferum]XP_026425650.1 FACT complex subunit SPT16-like isoform X2 [Papaver somniferum]
MEFGSDMLNRATWNDKVVAQLIRTKFIFWQVHDDTTEGRQVCNYYNLVSVPVVLLLDPISGKKMRLWSGMIRPRPLLKVLLRLVDGGPKDNLEPKGADSCPMEFPRCPIKTYLLTMAREKIKEKSRTCNEEELLEVERRLMQARLGAQLQQLNDYRLWLLSEGLDDDEIILISGDMSSSLQKDKKANVITLTGLEIFPKVGELGGETIVGNLDVHKNGFIYATSSPSFHFHFICADIKRTFFRVGDEKTQPLLHFHLHHPVKMGAEMRQDIQFRLVQTPVGQRTSYNDSEKQTRDGEDLKNFVHKVEDKWSTYTFHVAEVLKRKEFQGNLRSKAPTVFCLTFYALVGLVDEPFIVAYLNKIEIVSLRLKPAVIDMTIVFQDFKRDLIHINSIPIAALGLIKDSFNFAMVKYYEIHKDLPWNSMVKGIADSPREFLTNGGWLNYGLEDDATAKFYDYFYEKVEVKERKLDNEGEEICPYGSDSEGEESDTLEEWED